MARSKQPPIKREASSEYFNKKTATWEEQSQNQNGRGTNGTIINPKEEKEAGVLQLVIAVAGIYASL